MPRSSTNMPADKAEMIKDGGLPISSFFNEIKKEACIDGPVQNVKDANDFTICYAVPV